MPLPQVILIFQAALFGLIIGSFLNVCIYRIPQNLSLMGRSFCPTCKKMIPFYRNVPVLAYLFQRGRSACCHTPISPQYPLVEFLTGLLSVATLWSVTDGMTVVTRTSLIHYFVWFCLFVCPLIIVSGIDFELRIIPDAISLPFILVGIAVQTYERWPDWFSVLKFSGIGLLVGGGTLLVLAEVFSRLKGVDAMGGGDIKLAAMFGAFLGWRSLVFIFFASSFLALIYVVLVYIVKRQRSGNVIPFGPFLSMGAVLYLLYGKAITDFYFFHNGFGRNPLFEPFMK
jgi:leader peptidase (prepilin peptidase)/N-methyltransferase